jgi:ubiquitin-like 1-activating enzyme E1 B
MQKMVEIPLKPVKPAQPSPDLLANDDATVTGKRKREGSSDELELSSHDAKRLASASIPDPKSIEAIVLDDDEGGAITIDD